MKRADGGMPKPSSVFWSECGMLFVYQNFGLSTCGFPQHWDIIFSNDAFESLSEFRARSVSVWTPQPRGHIPPTTHQRPAVLQTLRFLPFCLGWLPLMSAPVLSSGRSSLPSISLCVFSTSNAVAFVARSLI